MTTHIKTAVLWLIIGAGVVAIFFDAWRRIDLRYSSEGPITEAMMCIIMGGIPSIAFAGLVYIAFTWLFMRPKAPLTTTYTAEVLPPQNAVAKRENIID